MKLCSYLAACICANSYIRFLKNENHVIYKTILLTLQTFLEVSGNMTKVNKNGCAVANCKL